MDCATGLFQSPVVLHDTSLTVKFPVGLSVSKQVDCVTPKIFADCGEPFLLNMTFMEVIDFSKV